MTTEQILEGNRLIAKYMGGEPILESGYVRYGPENAPVLANTVYSYGLLKYDLEWNWLMPVVLKIVTDAKSSLFIAAPGYINSSFVCEICGDQRNVAQQDSESPIKAVWDAVVQYLKSKEGKG